MLKNRKVLLLLPLIFAAFIFGLVKLFELRFAQGDVYPPASSLRADPLGAKVFYESLRQLDSCNVTRLYEPLNKVETGHQTTLFVLGASLWNVNWISRRELKEIENFLHDGGRIIISFQPINSKTWQARHEEKREQAEKNEKEKKEQKAQIKKKNKKKIPLDDENFEIVSLPEKWQFEFDFVDLETDEKAVAQPVTVERAADSDSLPATLDWHTALYFKEPTNSWKTIYARDTNAVVLERKFGKGSVVLSSDSYLFSNEAMRKTREPELLAWFVGANQNVIFDETHLGVRADPGIAALARKYRLHGLVAGLFLLAGLFVWKNSTSFVPPGDDDILEGRDAVVSGKESAAGFVNLLRRSIAPSEILSTCFDEWKKSRAHPRQKANQMAAVESLVRAENSKSPRERNPVLVYRNISTVLTEHRSPK